MSIHEPSGGEPGKKPRSGISANSNPVIQLATDSSSFIRPRVAEPVTTMVIDARMIMSSSSRTAIDLVDPSLTTSAETTCRSDAPSGNGRVRGAPSGDAEEQRGRVGMASAAIGGQHGRVHGRRHRIRVERILLHDAGGGQPTACGAGGSPAGKVALPARSPPVRPAPRSLG